MWNALCSDFLGSVPHPSPLLQHKVLPPPGAKIRIPADSFSIPLLPPTTVPKYDGHPYLVSLLSFRVSSMHSRSSSSYSSRLYSRSAEAQSNRRAFRTVRRNLSRGAAGP